MGVVFKCKCEHCGFSKELQLGSNNPYQLQSLVPSVCYDCKLVFTHDIETTKKIKCHSCKKSSKLIGFITTNMDYSDNHSVLFDWSINYDTSNPVEKVYVLEDKKFKCPYCDKMELVFYKDETSFLD